MTSIVNRHRRRRYRPRHYAECPNLLEHYSNDELYARYRFGRDDIAFICNILRPRLECATLRSHALTVEEQVLIALRFYASGSFFEVIGDGLAVRKSAVGHVVHSVSSALTDLLGQFVKWPENEDDMTRTKRTFFSLGGGGCPILLVLLTAPHAREWEYVNRKGRHSINVQLVGNADLVVTNCVVRWPGSVHDARILRASRLFQKFQQNTPDGILLVRDAIISPTNRNNPITPEIKCLATLRYLATGKMQLCNADDLGISQPSVSRAINQTLNALCRPHIIQQFIRTTQHQTNFMAIAGMPGVVGTHIKIIAPSKDEDVFVNRKKLHSINTQIVFDATFNIIDVVAKWPGSTHDSRILMESGLRQLFERHHVPVGCHLLGDSGYPCKTWLLTPYLNPQPGAQLKYNM
ncbi:putative nuclease HARBI1 [Merluccius polli]|uniref:Putative nuclease HARBI1 n=1 Tax=Merluccius polli TaxID=89951 RepID=A0AA47N8A9_MERPO|nr:putative nuclease HARBI1 [Merluccius polli]